VTMQVFFRGGLPMPVMHDNLQVIAHRTKRGLVMIHAPKRKYWVDPKDLKPLEPEQAVVS
jgi:hypothetical protein